MFGYQKDQDVYLRRLKGEKFISIAKDYGVTLQMVRYRYERYLRRIRFEEKFGYPADFPTRVRNALLTNGIMSFQEAKKLTLKDLKNLRGLGGSAYRAIQEYKFK